MENELALFDNEGGRRNGAGFSLFFSFYYTFFLSFFSFF